MFRFMFGCLALALCSTASADQLAQYTTTWLQYPHVASYDFQVSTLKYNDNLVYTGTVAKTGMLPGVPYDFQVGSVANIMSLARELTNGLPNTVWFELPFQGKARTEYEIMGVPHLDTVDFTGYEITDFQLLVADRVAAGVVNGAPVDTLSMQFNVFGSPAVTSTPEPGIAALLFTCYPLLLHRSRKLIH